MFHALLLSPDALDEDVAPATPAAEANAIFLPQFARALPLFIRGRATACSLNTAHAPTPAPVKEES